MTIALEERLARLELGVDGLDIVDEVLTRLDEPVATRRYLWLRAAVAALIVATLAVAILPGSRRAVAGWLGFDGVRIERVPELDLPSPSPELPGPGESTTVEVEGREILVSTIDSRLDDVSFTKRLGSGSTVQEVTVGGHRGLWISGDAHVLAYPADGGEAVRVVGNTLLWQAGDVLHRLEGFSDIEEAVRYATAFGNG